MTAIDENQDLLSRLQIFMKEMETPTWLIEKTIDVLKTKGKTKSEDDLYHYLEQLGQSDDFTLPGEFMRESWLKSIYESHSVWIENEITFYEGVTYESWESHIGKCPLAIQGSKARIQKSYLAVSSHLFNIFSQIEEVKAKAKSKRLKTNQNEQVNSHSPKKNSLFQKLLSFIGYVIIVCAYIAGIPLYTIVSDEGLFAFSIVYLIMALLPFVIGLVLTKRATFKNFFKQGAFRIYCFFTLVAPFGLLVLISIMEWKTGLLHTNDTIYLRPVSGSLTGFIHIFLTIFIIFLVAPIIANKKGRKNFIIAEIIFCIVFIVFHLITLNDYQMINKSNIVQSTFGSKQVYAWDEVEAVHLDGYIYEKYNPKGSGERHFRWNLEFLMQNDKIVKIDALPFTESALNDSIKIKKKVQSQNIPIKIEPLSEGELSIVQFEIEHKGLTLKTKFFELFEFN